MNNEHGTSGRSGEEALNRAWNDLVTGSSVTGAGLPSDLDDTLRQIHRLRTVTPMRASVRRSIKEKIMTAMIPVSPGQGEVLSTTGSFTWRARSGHTAGGPLSAMPRVGRAAVAALAAAALVATLLLGMYSMSGRSNDDRRYPSNGSAAAASPPAAATLTPSEQELSDWFFCGAGSNYSIAHASVNTAMFTQDQLDVNQVMLDSWSIEPGRSISGESFGSEGVSGIAVDLPLHGVYSATFDTDVVVTYGGAEDGSTNVATVPANSPVELVPGDAVAYALGTAKSVSNPLSSTALRFLTAVFSDGVQELSNSTEEAAHVTIGSGQLPFPLGQTPGGDPMISLRYSQELPGRYELPERLGRGYLILKPADPESMGEARAGYTLWLSTAVG